MFLIVIFFVLSFFIIIIRTFNFLNSTSEKCLFLLNIINIFSIFYFLVIGVMNSSFNIPKSGSTISQSSYGIFLFIKNIVLLIIFIRSGSGKMECELL